METTHDINVPHPPPFDGKDPAEATSFLAQLEAVMELRPSLSTTRKKAFYCVTLLTGDARKKVEDLMEDPENLQDWAKFKAAFLKELGVAFPEKQARRSLKALSIGESRVADFAVKFKSLAKTAQIDEVTKMERFYDKLPEAIKDLMVGKAEPKTFQELVDLAKDLDERLRDREEEKRARGELEREALLARRIERRTEQAAATNNAMEVDAVGTEVAGSNIPVAEALRRLRLKLCMRCGESGHNANNCSDKLLKEKPSFANKQGKKLYLWAQVTRPSALRSRQIGMMVDCGADSNFVDEAAVSSLGLVTKPRECLIAVIGVDGCPIGSGTIRSQVDLTLQLWDADGRPIVQEIRFNVIKSPKHPFILGLPWLKLTQPVIDWAEMDLTWPRGSGRCIPRVIDCGSITVVEAGMVETESALKKHTADSMSENSDASESEQPRPAKEIALDPVMEESFEKPLPRRPENRIYSPPDSSYEEDRLGSYWYIKNPASFWKEIQAKIEEEQKSKLKKEAEERARKQAEKAKAKIADRPKVKHFFTGKAPNPKAVEAKARLAEEARQSDVTNQMREREVLKEERSGRTSEAKAKECLEKDTGEPLRSAGDREDSLGVTVGSDELMRPETTGRFNESENSVDNRQLREEQIVSPALKENQSARPVQGLEQVAGLVGQMGVAQEEGHGLRGTRESNGENQGKVQSSNQESTDKGSVRFSGTGLLSSSFGSSSYGQSTGTGSPDSNKKKKKKKRKGKGSRKGKSRKGSSKRKRRQKRKLYELLDVDLDADVEVKEFLTAEELEKIPLQHRKYAEVFCKKLSEKLPPHRPGFDFEFKLILGKRLPVARLRPQNLEEEKRANEFVEEMLAKGYIRPSRSSTCAHLFFIEKPVDKKIVPPPKPELRPVIDYRPLNAITERYQYPSVVASDLLERLGKAKIFTVMDVIAAYNQLRVKEGHEYLTAFRTRKGIWESLVMTFGLADAPAYWQNFINSIFNDLIGVTVLIYFDDILVFSEVESEHEGHVNTVLERLKENGLYLKLSKCKFYQKEVKFLGFIVSSKGIRPDSDHIKDVLDWPTPKDRKDVQKFLGLINFSHQFIKDFAGIARPLNDLLRKDQPFIWEDKQRIAFETLKRGLTSAPLLKHPDLDKQFILETDSSDFALGEVLLQEYDGKLLPVAYASRSMLDAEKNYPIFERELLAIKDAFDRWRHFLEGAKHQVIVRTDHKSLEDLQTARIVNARQARWSIFFSRFNFRIEYIKGEQNDRADALSRNPAYVPEGCRFEKSPRLILEEKVFQVNSVDSDVNFTQRLAKVPAGEAAALRENPDAKEKRGIWFRGKQRYVPKEMRMEVLRACHDNILAGHFGVRKTQHLVQREFWWPGWRKDVKLYVESCHTCSRSKRSTHKPYGLLQPLPVPEGPWKSITMDFIVELPKSNGMTTIMTIVDRYSKMARFVALPKIPTAEETAKLVIKEVVRHFGTPTQVISDRGAQFTSKFWKQFLRKLGCQVSLSTAFHPQTDGQSERMNQTVEQYLRCFCNYRQDDWEELLPTAEFAMNNSVNESTDKVPFHSVLQFFPEFTVLGGGESVVPAAEELAERQKEIQAELKKNLGKAQERAKHFADRRREMGPVIKVGDMVWLNSENIRTTRPSKKLDYTRLGPFRVKRQVSEVAYELEFPPHITSHPVYHVAKLEPVKENGMSRRNQHPEQVPIIVDGHHEYEVEKVLDCKRVGRGFKYLVHWKDQPVALAEWICSRDVTNASELVDEFHRLNPEKPRPPRRHERGDVTSDAFLSPGPQDKGLTNG